MVGVLDVAAGFRGKGKDLSRARILLYTVSGEFGLICAMRDKPLEQTCVVRSTVIFVNADWPIKSQLNSPTVRRGYLSQLRETSELRVAVFCGTRRRNTSKQTDLLSSPVVFPLIASSSGMVFIEPRSVTSALCMMNC